MNSRCPVSKSIEIILRQRSLAFTVLYTSISPAMPGVRILNMLFQNLFRAFHVNLERYLVRISVQSSLLWKTRFMNRSESNLRYSYRELCDVVTGVFS